MCGCVVDKGNLPPHLRETFDEVMREALDTGRPLRDLLMLLDPADRAPIADAVTPGAGRDYR